MTLKISTTEGKTKSRDRKKGRE